MHNNIHLVVFLTLMQMFNTSYADQKLWELIKDEDGLQVYTLQTEKSDIIKARVVAVINAPLNKLRETIDDIERRHEWVPYLNHSKLIDSVSDKEKIEYSLFAAPWPASDRDFVYKLELLSKDENQYVYFMQSIVTQLKPEADDAIRADLFESIYTLTKLGANKTKVELVFHADPKGWLPNWIVNIIQRALPYRILKNLRKRLEVKH